MNPLEYILQVLDDYQLLIIFVIVYSMLLSFHWVIFKRLFNGLALLVLTSAIVFSVITDLYLSKDVSGNRILFFIFSEGLLYIVVLLIYKSIISKIDKNNIDKIINRIYEKYFLIGVGWLLIGIVINLMNVSWDGSSRIAFQTARWYSLVRMISLLIDPVVGLLLIHSIYQKKKFKLIILTLLTILLSATAGSKSGFVFSIAASFLIYRDLVDVKYKISPKIYIPLIFGLIGAMILNFYFLGIDLDKVFERIVQYAEATIMVYPAKNPCAACENQSMMALIHRGIGRTFKDPSSLDINNLFGYALSAEFYGENTLTGPNARIGSYALCAFPGIKILILYVTFSVFLFFNYILLQLTARKSGFIYISSILLVFHGTQHFILDYNTAMSDLTLVFFILIFISTVFILTIDVNAPSRTAMRTSNSAK